MIIVADSGSTKTDWRLIQDQSIISQFSCNGLNPHFHSEKSVFEEVRNTFDLELALQITAIHFYGSGASTEEKQSIIYNGFAQLFKNARIHIQHDLLGAARAACGKEAGLAGILGTGSNCCSYNGSMINKEFRSGGFMIGDEGGGVSIGKAILKAYIENDLPSELAQKFDRQFKTSYDDILTHLYKKPYPNQYIASYSRFAFHHRKHPFIGNILASTFQAFMDVQVKRHDHWKTQPLNLVGSIAFYYQDELRAVAEKLSLIHI